MVTEAHIERAKEIARAYGADRLILFGRAQTDPEAAHDLDLAVDGVPGWTIWKLAAELEEAIDVPLDVIPLDPSTPFTRQIEERGEVLFDRRRVQKRHSEAVWWMDGEPRHSGRSLKKSPKRAL